MDDNTARLWLVDSAPLAASDVGKFNWFIPWERRHWPIYWNPDDIPDMQNEDGVIAYPDAQREVFMTDRARARAEFEDAEVRIFRADLNEY